jgi:hypothetical protein
MIDISTEKLISLADAAALFPGRNGATVHPETVKAWARRGKKGVVLESVLAGPRRCTSVPAIQRFLEAVSAAPRNEIGGRTAAARARAALAVNRTERERNKAVKAACGSLIASGA